MPLDFLISALVTMVVVVDPLGLVPTFLAITHGLASRSRSAVALRAWRSRRQSSPVPR
jgi:multiple antibiotic resistance protein